MMEPMLHIVRSWGHIVIEAPDGYQAFCKLLLHRDFDLIITDLHMPVWDGYRFAKEARKKTKAPIIMHTGDIFIKATDNIDAVVSKGDMDMLQRWIVYFTKN